MECAKVQQNLRKNVIPRARVNLAKELGVSVAFVKTNVEGGVLTVAQVKARLHAAAVLCVKLEDLETIVASAGGMEVEMTAPEAPGDVSITDLRAERAAPPRSTGAA